MDEIPTDLKAVARRFRPPRRWYDQFQAAPADAYERFVETATGAVLAGWQESPQELAAILDALEGLIAYRPRAPLAGAAGTYWQAAKQLGEGLLVAFRAWLAAPPDAAAAAAVSVSELQGALAAADEAAVAYERHGRPEDLAAAGQSFSTTAVLLIAGASLPRSVPAPTSTRVRTWLTGLLTVVAAARD